MIILSERNDFMKKTVAIVLCFAFLLGSICLFSIAGAEEQETQKESAISADGEYMLIADNENLSLCLNADTADFCVLDKRSGKKWNTVNGTGKSLLNITYSGENNLSIQKDTDSSDVGFELYEIDNGFKTVFFFDTDNSSFQIPVQVALQDTSIKITVLFKEIKERGAGKVLDVAPYPNFGLGTADDDGYAFIPDGSGALIDYKDANTKNGEVYQGRIYGDDPSQDLIYKENNEAQTAKLPVFGVKQGKNAFLGVIDQCAEFASVNAAILSKNVSVYPSFIYHESDLTGIQQSDGGVRTMTIVQSRPVQRNPVVNYYFLTKEDASYSGMARCYRDYLLDEKVLTGKNPGKTAAASFEVFGAAAKSRTFLGISIKKMVYATTFRQLTDFEKKINQTGIENASYFLYGFLSGGYEGKTVTSPAYLRKLGGKKGYAEFAAAAGKDNVYTVYDIMRSYGRLFDFFRANDYTKSLNQTVVEQHYKNPANGKWDTDLGSKKYYNVAKQQKIFSKLLRHLDGGTNIVLAQIGQELPGDFSRKNPVNRDGYLDFYRQVFKKCKAKKIGLGFEGGNAYTLSAAKEIHEAPLSSGNLRIESRSVPFYTMVFHGYRNISSTPVNNESDSDTFLLRAFEQGVSATWRVAGCDGYLLKETKLNFLYNAGIPYVLKNVGKMAADYSEIHSVLYDQCITEHRTVGDISVTEYENGWKIVCNYGKDAQTYENTVVKPNTYIVIR